MNPDHYSFETKVEAAAGSGQGSRQLKLKDGEGVIHWIDTFSHDDETAYIHTGDGDSHQIGYDRLKDEFVFVPTENIV